jgi:hypothetical protein
MAKLTRPWPAVIFSREICSINLYHFERLLLSSWKMIMKPFRPRLKTLLLAGTFAIGASPAFAIEAAEVAERLKALLAEQQVELGYDDATLSGSNVTLRGVTLGSTFDDDTLAVGDLTLQDVREVEDGGLHVGTLALDAFEHDAGDISISMISPVIHGLHLPQDPATDRYGGMMRYDEFSVARIDVEGDRGPVASLTNLHADMRQTDDDGTLGFTGRAESFSLDLQSMVESGNAASLLEELGYSEVSGSAFMEGSWSPSDGRMTMSRYEATVDDAGTLHVSFDVAGYTADFARSIQQMASSMESADQEDQAMQGMAMLGLMQQLTFHGAAIRFTDRSLAQKVLSYQAEQMGTTPANLTSQARTMIAAQLSPHLGQEFANSAADAVATFLQDPGTLEISAQPASPMPFAMLMAAGMAAPQMLVRQIGLAVRANQ